MNTCSKIANARLREAMWVIWVRIQDCDCLFDSVNLGKPADGASLQKTTGAHYPTTFVLPLSEGRKQTAGFGGCQHYLLGFKHSLKALCFLDALPFLL